MPQRVGGAEVLVVVVRQVPDQCEGEIPTCGIAGGDDVLGGETEVFDEMSVT